MYFCFKKFNFSRKISGALANVIWMKTYIMPCLLVISIMQIWMRLLNMWAHGTAGSVDEETATEKLLDKKAMLKLSND